MLEKYLNISDFLEHILDNPDIFLAKKYENISDKAKLRQVLLDFLKGFLLAVQDCIDYEKTIEVAISYQIHHMIIDELFDQTDASIT